MSAFFFHHTRAWQPLARLFLRALRRGLWLCLPLLAHGGDLIRSQAVLEDPSGQWDIAHVAASDGFRPLRGVLVGGYSDGAFWLRLQIDPSPDGLPLTLRVRPTYVDEVRLYQQGPDGRWQVRFGGDRHGFTSAQRSINALGFEIAPQATTTYHLRLQTTSSAMLHVQALPALQASRQDARLILFQVAYLAFMFSVLLWAGHAYWRDREAVMGAFALYQANNLVFALALMGYLAPFEPADLPGWVDRLTSASVMAVTASGFVFHSVMLGMYAPHRGLLLALRALAVWVAFEFLIYFMGHERLALQANSMVVLAAGPLMLGLALSARQQGLPGLRSLRVIYAVQSLSLAATMLPYLGWIGAVQWSLQSTLIHGLTSACLMVYMLDKRTRLRRSQAEQDRQRAGLAEQRLQIQGEQVAAQAQFIDVLTHELKTPISVAMMSLGAVRGTHPDIERARRAMVNLDAIVERIRLSILADSRRLQPQLALSNVSVLVYECIEDSRAPHRIQSSVGFELEALTDAQLLGLIVTNLLDNALKYSPPDSVVQVDLRPHADPAGPGLCLRVLNEVGAAGLPDQARLFEKYYRSAGAQSQSGSGLGLFLSHHLALLMEARLSCQTGGGRVEFVLYIPTRGPSPP